MHRYIHTSRRRGSLVRVDLLVLSVLLYVFPNLFIKIRVSLSHFTDGKTEVQSGQACWDQTSSLIFFPDQVYHFILSPQLDFIPITHLE